MTAFFPGDVLISKRGIEKNDEGWPDLIDDPDDQK